MRRTLFITLFIIFSTLVQAQDYRSGHIITINQDTVRGYILYKESSYRFENCSFKKDVQGETHVYKPFEIFGYAYDNDRVYISKEIKIDSTTGKFFVENLVYGKASLYSMRGKFYLDAKGSLHELIILRVPVNNGAYIYSQNQYKDTLNTYLNDCPIAFSKIKSTPLSEKKLTKLVELYNSCFGSSQKQLKNNKPRFEFSVGLNGGYTRTKLTKFDRTAEIYKLKDPEQFIVDNGLFGGVSFLISSPRVSENIKFVIDVNYQKTSHESSFFNGTDYDVLAIRYSSLYMPISISYQFNNLSTSIAPFLELGVGLRYLLSSESFWQSERSVPPNSIFTDIENLVSFRKITNPLLIGIGVNAKITKKVDVIARSRFQYSECPFVPAVNLTENTKQFNLNITLGALIKITK